MKPLLYLLPATGLWLLLVRALTFPLPWAPPAERLAYQLAERRILTAEGRDQLLLRLRHHALTVREQDLLKSYATRRPSEGPVAILGFCADAFRSEQLYRTFDPAEMPLPQDDIYLGGEALALADAPLNEVNRLARQRQRRFAGLLRRFHGDTTAVLRELYRQLPPRFHIEDHIRPEDAPPAGGWLMMPPTTGFLIPESWISGSRSTLGRTRTRTARDLHALGLLDDATYRQLRAELRRGQLLTEEQVCRRGAELMQQVASTSRHRAEQARWLRRLHQAGLLSAPDLRRLSTAAGRRALQTPFDVLAYCPQARVLDLRRLPHDPRRLYPAVFARLPALLPGFRYADLRVRVSTDDSSYQHFAEDRVTLSFTASGRRYWHTFTQLGRPKDNAAPAPGIDISREFHASVNQWLTDQGSGQRLYLANTPDAQSVHGNERLGLLVLTAAQRPLWGEDPDFVSSEWHDDGLTTARKEQLLAEAERLGLLSQLTAAEKRRGRELALSGRKATFAELLESFPGVLFVLDWESANPPRPYADFTARLAAISRGAFRPTDVRDGFGDDFPGKHLVPFSFRHQGRLYRTRLRVQSDWLDAGVADLINEAMRASGSPGRFYECLDGEGFIFLTPAQHQHLRRTQPALFSTVDTTQIDKADLPF